MSEEAKENNDLLILDTKAERQIDLAYEILEKYFQPSELESKAAILERTLCEQKDDVRHGVLVAYRGDRMISCCIYDHFVNTDMVYVEYIATEEDERRNHVATSLLKEGIFDKFNSDILIDVVDPKKMEDASQKEIEKVCSKSRFWDKQGARKLGLEHFQQPDFENEGCIDEGAFLAIIPRDPETMVIDSERMAETLHIINTQCNGVEDPEGTFPKMFDELKQSPVIEVSQRSLVSEVVSSTAQEDSAQ